MACAVVATTADYAQIENLTLARGRFLRAEDEENVLRAAVLEDAVAGSSSAARTASAKR